MKAEATAAKPVMDHRQRYSKEFRERLVALTQEPGASVSAIALKHQLNTNLLFKWRRQELREQALARLKAPALLAVTVEGQARTVSGKRPAAAPVAGGTIEIELPAGRIRLIGAVDAEALRTVIGVLAER